MLLRTGAWLPITAAMFVLLTLTLSIGTISLIILVSSLWPLILLVLIIILILRVRIGLVVILFTSPRFVVTVMRRRISGITALSVPIVINQLLLLWIILSRSSGILPSSFVTVTRFVSVLIVKAMLRLWLSKIIACHVVETRPSV